MAHNDSLAHDWNSKGHKRKDNNLSPKNGNGYVNGNGNGNGSDALLKQNGDSQTWIPLLGHHPSDIDHSLPATNNNKWPALTSPANLSNTKYLWKELPQDEDAMGLYKPHLSGLNDKNGEHESLTGIVRSPINGFPSNDRDSDDDGPSCGIGMCRPKWMRVFASTRVFMVIFLLAWVLQVSL